MNALKCNRCERLYTLRYGNLSYTNLANKSSQCISWDLCETCAEKIDDFLESFKKEPEDMKGKHWSLELKEDTTHQAVGWGGDGDDIDDHTSQWGGAGPDCTIVRREAAVFI